MSKKKAEINETKMRGKVQKFNKTKSRIFEKISIIQAYLWYSLIKKVWAINICSNLYNNIIGEKERFVSI